MFVGHVKTQKVLDANTHTNSEDLKDYNIQLKTEVFLLGLIDS